MYRMTHACRGRKEAKGVPNILLPGWAALFRGKLGPFRPTLRSLQQTLSSKRCQGSSNWAQVILALKELSVRVTKDRQTAPLATAEGACRGKRAPVETAIIW